MLGQFRECLAAQCFAQGGVAALCSNNASMRACVARIRSIPSPIRPPDTMSACEAPSGYLPRRARAKRVLLAAGSRRLGTARSGKVNSGLVAARIGSGGAT